MKKADKFTQQTKTSGDFFIGQEVKLNTVNPCYSFGSVRNKEVGIITAIRSDLVKVDFKSQSDWSGGFSEFLVEANICSAVCKKAFPGVSVGQRFEYSSKPADFFNEEYFDFEYKTHTPMPQLEVCGYDVAFSKGKVAWGCRSFTVEELKKVLDAVEIIEKKGLQFRLGYESKHSRVPYSELLQVMRSCK